LLGARISRRKFSKLYVNFSQQNQVICSKKSRTNAIKMSDSFLKQRPSFLQSSFLSSYPAKTDSAVCSPEF